eukprot:1600987-Prorocentrum_lima.AAC.1
MCIRDSSNRTPCIWLRQSLRGETEGSAEVRHVSHHPFSRILRPRVTRGGNEAALLCGRLVAALERPLAC